MTSTNSYTGSTSTREFCRTNLRRFTSSWGSLYQSPPPLYLRRAIFCALLPRDGWAFSGKFAKIAVKRRVATNTFIQKDRKRCVQKQHAAGQDLILPCMVERVRSLKAAPTEI